MLPLKGYFRKRRGIKKGKEFRILCIEKVSEFATFGICTYTAVLNIRNVQM